MPNIVTEWTTSRRYQFGTAAPPQATCLLHDDGPMASVTSARYKPDAEAMRIPWVAPKRACSDLAATRFSAHSERGMNRSMAGPRMNEFGDSRPRARAALRAESGVFSQTARR